MNRVESQLLPSAPTATDGMLRRAVLGTIVGYLIAGAPVPTDGYLRRWAHEGGIAALDAASFPFQYDWLRSYFHAAVQTLCVVAEADAPSGMGGVVKVQKGGTNFAVYLVETSDPNATPVRVQTSAGTKAVRIKT